MITYTKIDNTHFTKTGHVEKFDQQNYIDHLEGLEKVKKELESQIKLEAAKVHNVYTHNKHLKEVSDEDKSAINILFEAEQMKEQCDNKLVEVQNALDNIEEELAEIQKQAGIIIVWKK